MRIARNGQIKIASKPNKIQKLLSLIIAYIAIMDYYCAYATNNCMRIPSMFSKQIAPEKTLETMIEELKVEDSYTASIPLLANAELGDLKHYKESRKNMLKNLAALERKPDSHKEWMRNNGFKAWMWGRVLLAAATIKDEKKVEKAKLQLDSLFAKQTEKDNLAFFTWARAYAATLNKTEYTNLRDRMVNDAEQLTKIYQKQETQSTKSNALWAWVMNLYAAAKTNNTEDYFLFKKDMMKVANTTSVTEALTTGLLRRTPDSNDYPAWALAIACHAAAIIGDKEEELVEATRSSINKAGKGTAEYILAVVNLESALGSELQPQKSDGCSRKSI